MKKKIKIIMLPTKEKAPSKILLWEISKELEYYTESVTTREGKSGFPQHLYFLSNEEIKDGDYGLININGHGTIGKISYDIKHNTWDLITADGIKYPFSNKEYIKKIIATTDESLNLYCWNCNHKKQIATGLCTKCGRFGDTKRFLPRPSNEFLKKYCEVGGIDEVLVEYEQDYLNRKCSNCNLGQEGNCELKLENKCCVFTGNEDKDKDYWISCLDDESDSEIYRLKVAPDNTISIYPVK